MSNNPVIALIDGEHYLPVIVEALAEIRLRSPVAAAVFAGGTEKISDSDDLSVLGCPVYIEADPRESLRKAIAEHRPDRVIDLSDEPILDYRKRFELISIALHAGLAYQGADFSFEPPLLEDIATKPSLSIIGTGKRVGKTAVSGFISRGLKASGRNPIVVAMGRGGPPEPEVVAGDKIDIDPRYLLEVASRGLHAASDYYEDALTSRVTTVGCRRCGGGMAGQPYISNVAAGVRIANSLEGDFLVLEGSGATLPPVRSDARLVVCAADQPHPYITGYLGAYRLMISDLVVLANCEQEVIAGKELGALIRSINLVNPDVKVVPTVFRPLPLGDISGARVFLATTAPEWVGPKLAGYLADEYGVEVVGVSHHLSNRPLLRQDLEAARGGFDVLLTELKAASVDVATRTGMDFGARVVYCDNVPVSVAGDSDLGQEALTLGRLAVERFNARNLA